jgi:beta-mannanase
MSRGEQVVAPLAILIATAAIALVFVIQLRDVTSDPVVAEPRPIRPDPRAEIMLGATTIELARNSYEPWGKKELVSINEFEQAAGEHAGVVMWFSDWEHHEAPDLDQVRLVIERGSIPEITWEPWDASRGFGTPQRRYRLRHIVAGRYDGLIRRWALALRSMPGVIRLRFAQEMNGNWYPWAEHANGNRPGEFVRAWRHVHDIFDRIGASNVEWVWSPVSRRVSTAFYPGDDYVDRVGLSGFNGGAQLTWREYESFDDFVTPALDELGRVAPGKPVELSEIGVAEEGGSKPAWIEGMFKALRRRPEVDALIWFNLVKDSDWTIQSSPEATRAFAEGVAELRFGQRSRNPARLR